jgi:hypothetical protein
MFIANTGLESSTHHSSPPSGADTQGLRSHPGSSSREWKSCWLLLLAGVFCLLDTSQHMFQVQKAQGRNICLQWM